jgi:hypothetical protein
MACSCSVCFNFRHAVSSGYSKEEKLVDQPILNTNRHTFSELAQQRMFTVVSHFFVFALH